MIIYTDGYTIGGNPSLKGGGYTLMDGEAKLLKQGKLEGTITNNEAEFRGILAALELASEGDQIITDSMICLYWIRSGKAKARPDLDYLIAQAQKLKFEKKVILEWQPRDKNLAGQFNEAFYE